jgi:hypothetical protein
LIAQFYVLHGKDFNTYRLGGFPQMSHRFPQIFINAPYGGYPQAIRLDFHRWYMPLIIKNIYYDINTKKRNTKNIYIIIGGLDIKGRERRTKCQEIKKNKK